MNRPTPVARQLSAADRRWWIASLAFCLAAAYAFPLSLGTRLLDPDEGLHASISQQMVETGDYVTPRAMGEPFRDKPILYFFAQALSLRCFGMTELAVRLPGMLFALLGIAATGLVARRLFDRDTGLIAATTAATMILPMALSQAPVHDVALTPWTNLLMLSAWKLDRSTSSRERLLAAGGVAACLALALLTKGLIGVAIVVCGYGGYVLWARRLTVRLAIQLATAAAVGVAAASPWFLAMEQASPGYLYYYFVERHFLGYATSSQRHGDEPWYYYLPILIGGSMPWMPYGAAWLFGGRARGAGPISDEIKLLLSWVVGGALFLSVAGSKLLTYALPVFPPLAILAAAGIAQYVRGELPEGSQRRFRAVFLLTCGAGCLGPFAALGALGIYADVAWPAAAWLVAAVAAALAGVSILVLERGRLAPAFSIGAAWMGLMLVLIVVWPLPCIGADKMQYDLAQRINQWPHQVDRLLHVGDRVGSVVFYLRPELRAALRDGRVVECNVVDLLQLDVEQSATLTVVDEDAAAFMTTGPLQSLCESAERVGRYRLAHGDASRVARGTPKGTTR